MFKALYSHINNIIEKYLQIYNHILLYLQWVKKEKIKTKATIKPYSLFLDQTEGQKNCIVCQSHCCKRTNYASE